MKTTVPGSGVETLKTPPLLLLAVLLFWGWQSGLLLAGAIMGAVLESSRLIKARWELTEVEFRRILTFCTLLLLGTAVYAFNANEEGGSVSGLFTGPGAVHNATVTSVRASTAFFRWLPMTLFLFLAAQTFSTREKIPWTAISLYSRWRSKQDRRSGATAVRPDTGLNPSYPYFVVCLFSAGIHLNTGGRWFFWGLCGLVAWALWQFRSRRYGVFIWAGMLAAVILAGYSTQRGIGTVQAILEGYNVRWLSLFLRERSDPMQTATAIGHIGNLELSGRIVIRLRTPENESPPAYLREASYRTYYSPRERWIAGTSQNDFANVAFETNQTTWMLLPDKTAAASVNIGCYLSGGKALLPLPTGCSRLENLYAYLLSKNSEGAVLAEGPGLVIFDAFYGPGETIDSPPGTGTNMLDLEVPTNEIPALKRVISQMHLDGTNEPQTLQTVYQFFQRNFKYSLWQKADKAAVRHPGEADPLVQFLLNTRSGHCEYFATATVLLLRELNIPARYAVGYYVHEESGHGHYVVRERDAHAWCLIWNAQAGTWQDFDTTPASWVAAESNRASTWQWLSDFRSWLGFQFAEFRWGQTHLRVYILWALVPILVLLLYQIVFRRGRRQKRRRGIEHAAVPAYRPGMDSEFYLLEKALAVRGVPRQPGELLSVWLARAMEEPMLGELREPLLALLRLHYRHRFDPLGLNAQERERLTREVRVCLESLSRAANLQ